MRSGYGARDSTKDSRHSVQVVDAASVVGFGVLGQEWLWIEHDWKENQINFQANNITSTFLFEDIKKIYRLNFILYSWTELSFSPCLYALQTYNRKTFVLLAYSYVDVSNSAQRSGTATNQKSSPRTDWHVGGCSYSNASGQCRVLNMDLERKQNLL